MSKISINRDGDTYNTYTYDICDNLSAKYLAQNPFIHVCTKRIEINYHFIEQAMKKELAIQ